MFVAFWRRPHRFGLALLGEVNGVSYLAVQGN